MFKFLKPTISLPANFLRTAFQTGTSIYHRENATSGYPYAAGIALEAINDIFPFRTGGLDVAINDNEVTSGYFLNEKGGMVIYCQYEDPSLFDFNRKSALFLIGQYDRNPNRNKEKAPDLKVHFGLLGKHTGEALTPDQIKFFAAHDKSIKTGVEFDHHDRKCQLSLTLSLAFANACFRNVLSNNNLDPKEVRSETDKLGYMQLLTNLGQMKIGTLAQFEQQTTITSNVHLANFPMKTPTA